MTEREDNPLALIEEEDTGDRFLVYRAKDGVRVELRVEGETFWATQAQMAAMFSVTPQNVTMHLKNIFAEGELAEAAVCKESLQTGRDGKRYRTKLYDLNALISVGYRVGGSMGTLFRVWATDKLFQYLTKGFVIDERRLKNPDGRPDYFDELLARVRDIRASEKRMWTRVLELASFCTDYDADDERQHLAFFAAIQNAMHYAVTQQTAAEIVYDRVDAAKPGAGLTYYDGDLPTVAEAKVAKNYLAEGEIAPLNAITSLALEFFESQAEQRRPTTLAAFLDKMRDLIKLDGRPLVPPGHKGARAKAEADAKASEQVALYKERMRKAREIEGETALRAIAEEARKREKARGGEKKNG